MNVAQFGPLNDRFCQVGAKEIKKIKQIFENVFTIIYWTFFYVVFQDHLAISKLMVVGRPNKDRGKI